MLFTANHMSLCPNLTCLHKLPAQIRHTPLPPLHQVSEVVSHCDCLCGYLSLCHHVSERAHVNACACVSCCQRILHRDNLEGEAVCLADTEWQAAGGSAVVRLELQ